VPGTVAEYRADLERFCAYAAAHELAEMTGRSGRTGKTDLN